MQPSLKRYLPSLCLSLGFLAACQAGTALVTTSPKINPQVEAAAQAVIHGAPTAAHTDANGRLQVYVYVADTKSETLGKLSQAGLVAGQASPEMGVVQGWIAPRDLNGLAALPFVKTITLPLYASPR